jgi:hypothetical protein
MKPTQPTLDDIGIAVVGSAGRGALHEPVAGDVVRCLQHDDGVGEPVKVAGIRLSGLETAPLM